MKEARYFYAPDAATAGQLPDDEATHALRVLRLKTGDELFLMDGTGTFYRAEVTLTTSKQCHYRITDTMPQQPTWRGKVHLAIAPTKMMDRIEWMAEKATEVGINAISFLSCRFSERKTLREDRIERIVVSAMKQSRKAWKPEVSPLMPFSEFIKQPRSGRKCICHCYEEIEKADFFDLCQQPSADGSDDITVLVGPEGDFSIDEVKTAIAAGYESVSLGTSRLRTETAGLAAVMMAHLCRRL